MRVAVFILALLLVFNAAAFAEVNSNVLKKAGAGDVEAQNEAGAAYFAAGDYANAGKWFAKGAGNGDATAQYNLATMYVIGYDGFPQDTKKALDGFISAAMKSHRLAQYNLGMMYLQGYVSETPDLVTGCSWIYLSGNAYVSGECSQMATPAQKKEILEFIAARVAVDGVNGGAPALNKALDFTIKSMTEN